MIVNMMRIAQKVIRFGRMRALMENVGLTSQTKRRFYEVSQ